MKSAFVLFIAVLLPQFAFAVPSRDLWIPQSRTLPEGRVVFDLQNQFTVNKTNEPGEKTHEGVWGGSVGLPEFGDFTSEIGFDWTEPTHTSLSAAITTNLRVSWKEVSRDSFSVAAGMQSYGMESQINDYNLAYLLFQSRLGDRWEMEFGGYTGNPNNQALVGEGNGVLMGLWTRYGKRATVGVEWQSGLNKFGYLFAGFSYLMREGVVVIGGYGMANNRGVDKDWALLRTSIAVF